VSCRPAPGVPPERVKNTVAIGKSTRADVIAALGSPEGADRRERFWAVSPGNGPAEQAVAEWIISVTPSDEEE